MFYQRILDVTEGSKTTYVCKTCKSFFVSLSEVTYHKAMTGHREYEERKPNANTQTET